MKPERDSVFETFSKCASAYLIEYFKKRNIKGLIDKLREAMDTDLPLKQKGACQDHKLKWSFITTHGYDSGEDLHVGHIGCNLHIGESADDEKFVRGETRPSGQGLAEHIGRYVRI